MPAVAIDAEIARTMLVGTSRASTTPAGDAVIDPLVARVAGQEPESQLLLRAGAWSVYSMAGRKAMPLRDSAAPAPADDRPGCPQAATDLLREIIASDMKVLLPEAFGCIHAAGMRLADEVLPVVLSLGDDAIRSAARPVLGNRGLWLSRFRDDWAWARQTTGDLFASVPDDAESQWRQGVLAERLAILSRVRAADPARARRWLEEAWPDERADARGKMLAVLETGLGLDDEAFLERALRDASSVVRGTAAEMLARVDGAGILIRLRERAGGLMTYTAPKAGKLASLAKSIAGVKRYGTLEINPPNTLDEDWARDIAAGKPRQGVGQRAWWLTQTLRLIPPSFWTERTATGPSELLDAIASEEWAAAVVEGLSRAAMLHRAADWAGPLYDWWGRFASQRRTPRELEMVIELTRGLLEVVPHSHAETRAMAAIEKPGEAPADWIDMAGRLQRPWSTAFGKRFIAALHRSSQQLAGARSDGYYGWPQAIELAARALPVDCLDEAVSACAQACPEDGVVHPWRAAQSRFFQIARIRIRFAEAMRGRSDNG